MTTEPLPNAKAALVVPKCDFGAASSLDLPVDIISADIENQDLVLECAGQQVVPTREASRALGIVALSATGGDKASAIAELWIRVTGARIEFQAFEGSDSAWQERAILREISLRLTERGHDFAQTATQAFEMLATLRAENENLRSALRQTRHFLLANSDKKRWLSQANGPVSKAAEANFRLNPGQRVIQRMPASSKGLSDVGLFIPDQILPQSGNLQMWLYLAESKREVGYWNIPAGDITPGWLRASLIEALDDDEQTVMLDLNWSGDTVFFVGASLHHPDPDFRAYIAGEVVTQMLAHRIWKYLPGATAGLPANAFFQASKSVPFHIDPEHLATAKSANSDADSVKFFPNLEALQVHPRKDTVSAARVLRAVPPGTREIRATIGGRHEHGPSIEYAVAVLRARPVKELGDVLDDCLRNQVMSDWFCLRGDEQGELTHYLKHPVYDGSDLLLVTRLAPRASSAFAWATFRNIRLLG